MHLVLQCHISQHVNAFFSCGCGCVSSQSTAKVGSARACGGMAGVVVRGGSGERGKGAGEVVPARPRQAGILRCVVQQPYGHVRTTLTSASPHYLIFGHEEVQSFS